MNLTYLSAAAPAHKARTRRGRGPGSGKGKTAGKGHKGAMARKSYKKKLYFEGGGMPMVRKLPKRGFNNKIFATNYSVLNVSDLDRTFENGAVVGPEDFLKAGLINRLQDGAKVLAKGEITKKLTVSAHCFSEAAAKKIVAAGGKANALNAPSA